MFLISFFIGIVLPSKFSENLSGKIPKKVSLIGPSGLSWEVEVSTTDNIAIVGEGWKDFAKTFNLEENYLLVFKYRKNLSFEVLIFDQSNSCEKEYCYFVQKGLPNPDDNVDRKRSADESPSTEIMEDNIDGNASDCVMSKKPKKCSATDPGEKKVVEAPRATPSSDHDDVDPDFVQNGLPNPNDNVDRKRSVDKTASTEIMEDNIDGNASDCVMLKKSKKCSATDQGQKKVVEAPRETPSSDHDDVDPDFVQKGLPNPNGNVDRKRSADETASTEIMEGNIDGNVSDCVMLKKPKKCSATDQGKKKVVEAPRDTPSSDHDDVDPDFVQKGLPNPNGNVDRKRSADETASTEIMEDNIDGNASDCVMLKKSKKCSATDQGKKKVVEALRATPSSDHDDVDPDFVISEKVRNDAVVAVSSSGRPLRQVYGSLLPKKAKVPDCASTKKLKNCSVYQRKKKIVKCPITTLAEFDSSGKTRADAIEVNEADDIADDTPINMVVAGLRATKSKGQSAKKSSDNTAASWTLSQHKAIQQTPTGIGENEMCKESVLSTGNNDDALSNALCVEPLNICRSPGTIRSLKVGAKRGRPVGVIPRSGKKLASKRYKQRVSKEYMSCRRPVTDEEKRATVKRATKALSEGSFLVVMRPTGVYRRFFLSIPGDWINKNLSSDRYKVILRVGEKTWEGKFHNNKVRHSAGLASGWKNFAIENNLEDSDVCVFTPASQKGDGVLILDVKIFRVVPEVTPLKPMLMCRTV